MIDGALHELCTRYAQIRVHQCIAYAHGQRVLDLVEVAQRAAW
jgi:hypothetical protein